MFYYTIVFVLIAVMAGAVGLGGPPSTAGTISVAVFIAFLALSAASLVLAIFRPRHGHMNNVDE
jgi:uncharacterized membrane protein YtjA (UPF0391 family)